MTVVEPQDRIKYGNFISPTTSPHWVIFWTLYEPSFIIHLSLNKISCFFLGKFAVSSAIIGYCLQETIAKIALVDSRSMISVVSFWVTVIVHLFWSFSSCYKIPGSHLLAKSSWIKLHPVSERQACLQLAQYSDLVVQIFVLQDG